jgi:hypothetical protein
MHGFHMKAVITDEPPKGKRSGRARLDQREGEARFSRTRRPADQDRAGAD